MHATFVTLWLQVMQPLANVHETKWTPHVKRESDVAQSYNSSDHAMCGDLVTSQLYNSSSESIIFEQDHQRWDSLAIF